MKLKLLGLVFAMMPSFLMADYNVTGSLNASASVNANGGNVNASANVNANGGHVYALSYVQCGGEVNSGSYVLAQGYIYSNSYMYAVSYLKTPGYLLVGNAITPGSKSAAIGEAPTANAYSSLVVGRYNITKAKDGVTNPSSTAWQDGTSGTPVDPLFVVGNGTGTTGDPNQYRNALTVYKDGTITMSKPQGDIPMGQFGN